MYTVSYPHTRTDLKNPFNRTLKDRHGQAAQERSKSQITTLPEARPASRQMSLSGCLQECTETVLENLLYADAERIWRCFLTLSPHSERLFL